ncbi:hypothetical protein FD06_GL000786 [Apilactobacillus ozensis DSM 23829 = JCM 17196]|uniref:CRISPR-associated endoribonuclease Cas2 n=2 Tax=Apilactobacillus ozensis TaxID=866801 RepID=A0A0R2AMD6_9LACO|nr:hypothetical protein FD06_GL000786 [Apilactobacillus ozensis DSM 23829 = JCM 17196]
MFDLPVTKAQERKAASKFRKYIIENGFYMLQYSVYTRIVNNFISIEKYTKRLKSHLPNRGSIYLLTVTDNQYSNMNILVGKPPTNDERVNSNSISLF